MNRSAIMLCCFAPLVLGYFTLMADNKVDGNGKLDFFSSTAAPADSSSNQTSSFLFNSLPEKYWPYDSDVNNYITADELNVAVQDFSQKDSPYTQDELAVFIDFYFNQAVQ